LSWLEELLEAKERLREDDLIAITVIDPVFNEHNYDDHSRNSFGSEPVGSQQYDILSSNIDLDRTGTGLRITPADRQLVLISFVEFDPEIGTEASYEFADTTMTLK
jgi:hypothetical protein